MCMLGIALRSPIFLTAHHLSSSLSEDFGKSVLTHVCRFQDLNSGPYACLATAFTDWAILLFSKKPPKELWSHEVLPVEQLHGGQLEGLLLSVLFFLPVVGIEPKTLPLSSLPSCWLHVYSPTFQPLSHGTSWPCCARSHLHSFCLCSRSTLREPKSYQLDTHTHSPATP